MDELVERANTWLASERERKERARDVGRSWLALLVAGDSDKVAAFIIDLADGSGSLEYDVITELQKNATAYTEQVTRAAFNHIIRRRSNQGCSCGCDACEEEGDPHRGARTGALMVNEQRERGPVLPFDQDSDVVFMRHELFTFYGGEECAVPEELVAVFEYPAKQVYEYEFESREGERGLATRRSVHYELLATKRECQVLLAELRTKGRYHDELVKALHTWPEG